MLKFIAACMGIVAFAFFAVPVFFNIASERQTIIEVAQTEAVASPSEDGLVAVNSDVEEDMQSEFGAFLNDIAPAAGEEAIKIEDDFGAAFEVKPHPAL